MQSNNNDAPFPPVIRPNKARLRYIIDSEYRYEIERAHEISLKCYASCFTKDDFIDERGVPLYRGCLERCADWYKGSGEALIPYYDMRSGLTEREVATHFHQQTSS